MNNKTDVLRDRRPEKHVCKNCEYIVVAVNLPDDFVYDGDYNRIPKEPKDIMRETAKAMKITNESNFYCILNPEWKLVKCEDKHFCSQFVFRDNWQLGYQDIERTWERVDQVYATRWDCIGGSEGVRRRKAAMNCWDNLRICL